MIAVVSERRTALRSCATDHGRAHAATIALAERAGLRLTEAVPMPANNFVLVFTRRA